ncbi:MAG: hypothetical protein ACM336_04250 [Acidobacteriota bacterium]
MLAYVFWHWPKDGVETKAYENALGRFHQALKGDDAPDGFISSASFRIARTEWTPRDTAYEDWYLLTDFDALGNLNEAALANARAMPHVEAAAQSEGGAAGLYGSIAGQSRLTPVRFAAWLSKPRGMTYKDFFAALAPHTTKPDITLWQRQMSLGPAREFCLHATGQHELPEEFRPHWIELTPVWPA